MGFEASMMTKGNPLPKSWKVISVGEVADINRATISANNTPKWIEYIDISSVGERRMNNPVPMEFNLAPSRARRKVFSGDILISTVRPNLKHFIYLKNTKPNWIASTGFAVVSPKQAIEPLYLYYYLTSGIFTEYLTRVADGGAYPAFNPSEIQNAELLFPPLPEQKAIARILSSLDDKIELNQQMNRTLEAQARAIFKSWFVDFDPVRAKMEGRQPVGMDAATTALFPDAFEESKLGMIPKGWRVKTIGDICEFAYGKPLKAEDRQPGSIPVYGSNGQIGWHNQALVKGSGIVVGRKGNPGVVTWASKDFYPIDITFYVVPKNEIFSLYYLFYSLLGIDLSSLSADSAVPGLNRNLAYMTKILVSDSALQKVFDKRISIFSKQVDANIEQSQTISTMRNFLLPKLMSGEIRVKEAEKMVEEAT